MLKVLPGTCPSLFFDSFCTLSTPLVLSVCHKRFPIFPLQNIILELFFLFLAVSSGLIFPCSDKAPGQRECDSSIDNINRCIRDIEQASLAAVSQNLPSRDDISLEVNSHQENDSFLQETSSCPCVFIYLFFNYGSPIDGGNNGSVHPVITLSLLKLKICFISLTSVTCMDLLLQKSADAWLCIFYTVQTSVFRRYKNSSHPLCRKLAT